MQTPPPHPAPTPPPAATAAEPSPARYVVRLAGEVDKDELEGEIGLAGVCWLVREKRLATYPSPPPRTSHASQIAGALAAVQIAAADGERSLPRHVVRLAGEVDEDSWWSSWGWRD